MLEINDDTILEKQQEEDVNFREQDEKQLEDESAQEIKVIKEIKKIETSKKTEQANEKVAIFLRGKGLSDDLVNTLINNNLTDEYVRLLKTLDFDDIDIKNLRDLRTEIEISGSSDSNSITFSSSSDARLSQIFFLKETLSKPLIGALREIVAKKPADPVEYLGHWLLHFKVCEERDKRRKEEELELLLQREKLKIKETEEKEPVLIERPEDEEEEREGDDWDYLNYDE